MTNRPSAEVLAEALNSDQPIDVNFAQGRLTLEERHPLLCLHRGPADFADHATAELLLGQACFALAPPATPYSAEFADAVQMTLAHLSDTFNTVLLLEIFTLERSMSDFLSDGSLHFECHVPKSGAADPFLTEFERSIVAERWPGGRPKIDVAYDRAPHPPALRPLLPSSAADEAGIIQACIGVTPIYRDHETGDRLPLLHREFRISFGRVLKKALYAFCHSSRVHLPAHYHALGRTRLDERITAIDQEMCDLAETFDPLLLATPVNARSAWNTFRADRYDREPVFHYRPLPIDPADLKRAIYRIPMEQIEDPTLHRLFATKRTELDRFATMLEDRETDRFLLVSRQIFGAPDVELIKLAREILEHVPPHAPDDRASDALDAEAFANAARADLRGYGLDPETVEVRDDIPGLMVSRGRFLIGRDAKVARRRVRATLDHEVGVHVLTHRNGAEQPFAQLRQGMAGYEELQEGLAVFAEFCSGGLTRPRWRQIAGRVVAVASLVDGAGFLDIFRLLHREYDFGTLAAFTMTMRTVRGGGFTKDMVYLRGLNAVVEYARAAETIEPLLVGKVSYDHLDLLDELKWRGLVRPARFRPAVFEPDRLRPVIDGLKSGIGLVEMARSSG